jgi:hypothetical protein
VIDRVRKSVVNSSYSISYPTVFPGEVILFAQRYEGTYYHRLEMPDWSLQFSSRLKKGKRTTSNRLGYVLYISLSTSFLLAIHVIGSHPRSISTSMFPRWSGFLQTNHGIVNSALHSLHGADEVGPVRTPRTNSDPEPYLPYRSHLTPITNCKKIPSPIKNPSQQVGTFAGSWLDPRRFDVNCHCLSDKKGFCDSQST